MIDPVAAHLELAATFRFYLGLTMQAGLAAAAIIGGVCVGVALAGPGASLLLLFPAAIAAMTAALSGLFLHAARGLAQASATRAAAVGAEAPQVWLLTATLGLFAGGFAVLALILLGLAL